MKAAIAIIILVILFYIGYQDFQSGSGVFASLGKTPADLLAKLKTERAVLAKALSAAKAKAAILYKNYQVALGEYRKWDQIVADCNNNTEAWCVYNKGVTLMLAQGKLMMAHTHKLTTWKLSSEQYKLYTALEEELAALDKKIAIIEEIQAGDTETA